MLYWSTIFNISSVFFRYSNFVQIRVEIILRDNSCRFWYSIGYVFYAKVLLDNFDFSNDFYALDFLRFAWSKILNHNFKQLNSIGGNLILKVKWKRAPKLVPFSTLNLNSGTC